MKNSKQKKKQKRVKKVRSSSAFVKKMSAEPELPVTLAATGDIDSQAEKPTLASSVSTGQKQGVSTGFNAKGKKTKTRQKDMSRSGFVAAKISVPKNWNYHR